MLPPVCRHREPAGPSQPTLEAVRRAAELYALVRMSPAPADLVMARDFKARPMRHPAAKGEAAALAYMALRRGLYLDELAKLAERSRNLPRLDPGVQDLSFALLDAQRWKRPDTLDAISAAFGIRRRDVAQMAEFFDAKRGLPNYRSQSGVWLSKRLGFPEWIVASVRKRLGDETAAALTAMNDEPPLVARANTSACSRDELAAALAAEHISSEPGVLAPDSLYLGRESDPFATKAFRDGLFEIQDEGSQLVGHLVHPLPGQHVLDLCAGAGGKSLHLGALMRGRGEVIAYDTDARKLARARKRIRRSGLQNVRLIESDEAFAAVVARLGGQFDRVLVDAPCSGLGTVRRSPDITFRIQEDAISRLTAIQGALLDRAAELVAPGGRVVYATCSILHDENASVVRRFLKRHKNFRPIPVAAAFPDEPGLSAAREAAGKDLFLELWPHRHGTDGFFAAVLERLPTPDGAETETPRG